MPQTVQGKNQSGSANLLIYLAGAVLIILVLLLVFGRGGGRQPTSTPGATPLDTQVQQLKQQSNSDEISAINADLQNTNLDKIDAESADIDNALQNL